MEAFPAVRKPESGGFDLAVYTRARRPLRTLLLNHGAALEANGMTLDVAWLVSLGETIPEGSLTVCCEQARLPFTEGVFDLVVACNVLADGSEEVLPELSRILIDGGHLVISGAGHWSRKGRSAARRQEQRLYAGRVCRKLREMSFAIEACEGRGVLGWSKQVGYGWNKPLVDFSDEVLIHARHHESRPDIRPLKFKSGVAAPRGAALDGVNREAVA